MKKALAGFTAVIAAATLSFGAASIGDAGASDASRRHPSSACLAALNHAEQVIRYLAQDLGYSAEGVNAAASGDAEGINQATAEVDALLPFIRSERQAYNTEAALCRVGR